MALCGKGDFARVIKLRILRWEVYPGLTGLAQYKHKGPYKREVGGSELTVGDVKMKAKAWSDTRLE